jgi:hypothetical protein
MVTPPNESGNRRKASTKTKANEGRGDTEDVGVSR